VSRSIGAAGSSIRASPTKHELHPSHIHIHIHTDTHSGRRRYDLVSCSYWADRFGPRRLIACAGA